MYISIEGNIGVGKTTIAKALAKKLNAHFLAENFKDNDLLPLFYQNKKKFSLITEYSFLIDRYLQMFSYFKKNKNKLTVSDFHFDKSLCFGRTNLTKKEFALFKKSYNEIKANIPEPNLFVYLETETNLLIKNIHKRGRDYESDIQNKYLQKINNSYKKHFLSKKTMPKNILKIGIKHYNQKTASMCCDKIIETLNFQK